MHLASAHAKLWRRRVSLEVVWDEAEEQEEPAPPMGFGSGIEALAVEDGEVEDRRVGF